LPCAHSTIRADLPRNSRYPTELRTLSDHLRKRRLDLGLLQREVARKLGVSEATVWQWETRRTEPETQYIPRIHDFLQYCPWEAIGGFPDLLRRYRMAAGLSQEELAAKARIDESTLAKWERGDTRPLPETLHRLRMFFAGIGMPKPPTPSTAPDGVLGQRGESRVADESRCCLRQSLAIMQPCPESLSKTVHAKE